MYVFLPAFFFCFFVLLPSQYFNPAIWTLIQRNPLKGKSKHTTLECPK